MLPSEPPKKLTPAPAKVILDVDANTYGRFGLPASAARPEHVDLAHEVVRQGVHRVGVVPEQPEIRCGGRHLDEPTDRLPGVDRPVGLRVHRHAPHALDRGVAGDEFLDQVDVGAVLVHRDRDHLDAERLGDREVPVVAGRRAQELDARLRRSTAAASRRRRAAARTRRSVVHHLEAGVVAGDQVLHRDAEQLTEDRPQLGQPVQAAVVAGVGALAVAVVVSPGRLEQAVGQVELLRATACRGSGRA